MLGGVLGNRRETERRDALPATYCPPAPLSLQEIQYVVWPPLYCHSNEHLRLCSKHLSYLDWNSIDSPISGPAISKSIEYPDCFDKDGRMSYLSTIFGLTRMNMSNTSYLNDETINGFGGWLTTVFPGVASYVPVSISAKAKQMASLYHVVSARPKVEDHCYAVKETRQYLDCSRALKRWLLGKPDFLNRSLILYPVNTKGIHW